MRLTRGRWIRWTLALLFAVMLAGCNSDEKALIGTWNGTLDISKAMASAPAGIKLRIECQFEKGKGGLTGTLKSVDQGGIKLDFDTVKVESGEVTLEIKSLKSSFSGKLSADKSEIAGTWTQATMSLPLTLKKAG